MEPNPIRVIALCSQILGVFFLFKAISVKTPKYVLHELLAFRVNKSRFFRKHISQKLESAIGFGFLFVGFALQIYLEVDGLAAQETRLGAEGGAAAPAGFTNWGLVMGVTIAALIVIAVVLNRITRYFSGRIFVELVRFMVVQHNFPLENDERLLLELGKIMRIKRDDQDTTESYTEKILEKMDVHGTMDSRSLGRLLSYR